MEIESVAFERNSRNLKISFSLKVFLALWVILTSVCCGLLVFLVFFHSNRDLINEYFNFVVSINFTELNVTKFNLTVNLTKLHIENETISATTPTTQSNVLQIVESNLQNLMVVLYRNVF